MDGGCSDFEDRMGVGDEAGYHDDVVGRKREVVEGVE